MLRIRNLEAAAGQKEILRGVDMEVAAGEIHVILGKNGAGKSTLLNAIMGHPKIAVRAGEMIFCGEDLIALKPYERARRGIFLSFQSPQEIPGITTENLLRTARATLTGQPQKILGFRKELRTLMNELEIGEEYATRYLNVGFSGGEKKRNEILQLLALKPKLALLDETDSGLDVDAVEIVSRGIAKYHTRENACVIITHNAQILKHLQVDKVHVMLAGRIVQQGGVELIATVVKHGYTPFEELL